MSAGFIGLGNIGAPMARQLLKLEAAAWVYDIAPSAVGELVARGARAATSPRQLAQHCRHIGICVRDEADVEAVLQGGEGVFAGAAAGSVIAVHSTVAQQALLRWAQQARAHGVQLLDAPVTGGAAAAEQGTLIYMVGGDAQLIERCRPFFMTSGDRLIHAGAVGAGILLKLCNNLMSYAAFAAAAEAQRLAHAGGLDPALLREVGRGNGVVTAQMEAFLDNRAKIAAAGAGALQHVFGPFAALARKDLGAALASARECGVDLPQTACVAELISAVFLQPD